MKLQVVLAGAAVLALVAAGTASSASRDLLMRHRTREASHFRETKAGRYSAPSQPIAYSKLDSYMKASPHARASENWGLDNTGMAAGSAAGAGANASATAPQAGEAQPSGAMTSDQQGASAPAPSAQAPNPPTSAPSSDAPQSAPDTSTQPPAAPSTSQPQ